MRWRREPPPETPDLSPEVISILLCGWSAPTPPEPSAHGFGHGMLELYEPDNAAFIRFWTEHKAYLRQVAKRWRWAPQWELDGRLLYYAEFLVSGGRDGPDVDDEEEGS